MKEFLNKIFCESNERTMARMTAETIDLTITSPPYDKQRTYNGYSFEFEKTAEGLFKITKKGGVVVWIVADGVENGGETGSSFKQSLHFMSLGFLLHDTMIYQKRNFSHPGKRRYHSVFEFMFVFSKGKPKTFNPLMDRKNLTAGEIGNKGVNTFTMPDGSKSERTKKLTQEFGMRHNVWLGNTRGQEDMCMKLPHPAMMPKWLAADHILTWTNKGDIVYDPFGGSGTTALEAIRLKRNFIISEISKEYCAIAETTLQNELGMFYKPITSI